MENGETHPQKAQPTQPETPQEAPKPEEQKIEIKTKEAEKPKEPATQLLEQISQQVKTEREQTPPAERDLKGERPETEIVGITVAPKTKPSPENSIPEIAKIFQEQSKTDEGAAAKNTIDTINKLGKAA